METGNRRIRFNLPRQRSNGLAVIQSGNTAGNVIGRAWAACGYWLPCPITLRWKGCWKGHTNRVDRLCLTVSVRWRPGPIKLTEPGLPGR